MEFHKLILENFGLFKGHHEIVLTPRSPKQPIVLFGGLNGGGKTTLLDAIQLALYGKLARCSNRGTRAYPDYLAHCIHKGADVSECASVAVELSQSTRGESHSYLVERRWSDSGKGVQEQVSVWKDNQPDPVLTESWPDFMEDLLPARIAPLFFFDGEKIEGFADPHSSAELLSTAVQSLLGLDIVDHLSGDLVKLERRSQIRVERPNDRSESAALVEKKTTLEQEHDRLFQERASIQNEIDIAKKDLSLLRHCCHKDGVGLDDETLATQFRLHLHRGIGYLAADRDIRSLGGLMRKVVK